MSDKSINLEVRKLREELYQARSTIIHCLDDKLRDVIEKTRAELYKTRTCHPSVDLVNFIVDSLPPDQETAFCPLCGDGTNAIDGHRGFLVPLGLSRHIYGHGNMQCWTMREIQLYFNEIRHDLYTAP